jgi:hypothetical protein
MISQAFRLAVARLGLARSWVSIFAAASWNVRNAIVSRNGSVTVYFTLGKFDDHFEKLTSLDLIALLIEK